MSRRVPSKKVDAVAELKKFTEAKKAIARGDAWQNVLTGLGVGGKDWQGDTRLVADCELSQGVIDSLYAQENLAAKIVDAPAMHACRRWFKLTGGSGDEAFKAQVGIFKELDRLNAKQRFQEWLQKGAKDGGALMLIGADDGARSLDRPLKAENIRKISHLHILERWAVWPDMIDVDPESENFGKSKYYKLLPRVQSWSDTGTGKSEALDPRTQARLSNTRFHFSRVFFHDGIQISERRANIMRGYGYSALQRAYNSIENYRVLWGHISMLFKHVSQTVVKFGGYPNLEGADFEQAINARIQQIQLQRSTSNVVAMDAADELEEQTLGGIGAALEIFKFAQDDLAQVANMPLTMLFGHTPEGFSSDDVAGTRNFYDGVHVLQEARLLKPLRALVDLISTTYKIALPDDWGIEFLPLMEPTDQEAAVTENQRAMTAQVLVMAEVLSPEEVRDTMRADPMNNWVIGDGPAKNDSTAHPELIALRNPPKPVVAGSSPGGASPPAKPAAKGPVKKTPA